MWAVAVVWVIVGLLTGCGDPGEPDPRSDEEQIADRSHARWHALMDGAFEDAYNLESPAFREVYSLRAYRGRFGHQMRWTGAEVLGVDVDEDLASVRVLVSYVALGAGGTLVEGERPLQEQWLRERGEWWHVGR